MLNLILFVLCGKQYTIDLVCLCSVENSTQLTLFVFCGKQWKLLEHMQWKPLKTNDLCAL